MKTQTQKSRQVLKLFEIFLQKSSCFMRKTSAQTQKVGAFRIPDCQKSVQKQGMLPLDFEGGNHLMSGGGSTLLTQGHSCILGSLQRHKVFRNAVLPG